MIHRLVQSISWAAAPLHQQLCTKLRTNVIVTLTEVCKYLIEDEKSASINKTNSDGDTPLKIATDANETAFFSSPIAAIAYLESKGAILSGMSKEEAAEIA